jgi:endonuclease/exonuclease/phosphatase family metal-dependent hydrolase
MRRHALTGAGTRQCPHACGNGSESERAPGAPVLVAGDFNDWRAGRGSLSVNCAQKTRPAFVCQRVFSANLVTDGSGY